MNRVERAVAERQARMVRRVAKVVRAGFPELAVEEIADGVVLVGRGLARRRLGDARLRTIAVTVREHVA